MNSSNFPVLGSLLAITVFFLGLSSDSYAQKINWGSAANDINVDSNNVGLDNVIFTFQLGTFTNGGSSASEFVPDASNTDFWGTNWIVFDTATYNQEAPPTDNEGFFSDSWVVPNNDYQGFQAYIWVYNNLAGDETSEWALITELSGADEWQIPIWTDTQEGFPTQFRVSTATDVIFGGLNNVDGEGERGTDPGTYALQTQTFLAVPETGTTLLFGLTLGSLVVRRGRQSS